jgi:hypothetical protein
MSEQHDKTEKPPPPEYRTFTEALTSILSVSKREVQERISKSQPEKVSRFARYKYVPSKPPQS